MLYRVKNHNDQKQYCVLAKICRYSRGLFKNDCYSFLTLELRRGRDGHSKIIPFQERLKNKLFDLNRCDQTILICSFLYIQ